MTDEDKQRKNDFDEDYERARNFYHKLIEKFESNIEIAEQIIKNSEHPRAIEVFTQMLKGASDINNDLLELHKKDKSYRSSDSSSNNDALPSPDVTNNTYFLGSTKELQDALHEKYDPKIIEDNQDDRNSDT